MTRDEAIEAARLMRWKASPRPGAYLVGSRSFGDEHPRIVICGTRIHLMVAGAITHDIGSIRHNMTTTMRNASNTLKAIARSIADAGPQPQLPPEPGEQSLARLGAACEELAKICS